jgi:hypothetical protein
MPIGSDAVYVPADIQWEDSTVDDLFEHPTLNNCSDPARALAGNGGLDCACLALL